MIDSSQVFNIVLIGLLAAPLMVPILALSITMFPPTSQRWMYSMLATAVGLILALHALDISSPSPPANAVTLMFAIWALLLMLLSAYRLRSKLPRYLLGSVAVLLLLLCALMGTLGTLLIAFMVGDVTPIFSVRQDPDRACYVTSYGNATTRSGGFNVTITQQLAYIPFLEVVIMRRQYEWPGKKPEELCNANT